MKPDQLARLHVLAGNRLRRTSIGPCLIVLASCLLMCASCRTSSDEASSTNRTQDRQVRAMTDATAPEPLTALYLIERVHRFYPRFKPLEESMEVFYERLDQAPETTARWSTIRATREGRTQDWRALHSALERRLPGYQVWNVMPGPLTSFNLGIAPAAPADARFDKTLVFSMSHLAPLYFVYESHMRRYSDEPMRIFDEPTDAFPGVLEIVDRELTRRFGVRRIDPELARLPVQDIQAGNLRVGEATVADALFDDDRM